MRNQFKRQNNTKIIVYAIAIAVILGLGIFVMQDIQVPVEHITQQVEVNLEK
jgi:low affinity Fe/Cu permease